MPTITSKLIDVCFLVVCAAILTACAPNRSQSQEEERADLGLLHQECDFRTAQVNGKYCQVSVYALLSNPDQYVGRKVFTYGYLIKSGNNDFGLYVEPRFRSVPDYASCLKLRNFILNDDEDLAGVEPLVIYSISLGGTFSKSSDHVCAGVLSDVDVSSFAKELIAAEERQ